MIYLLRNQVGRQGGLSTLEHIKNDFMNLAGPRRAAAKKSGAQMGAACLRIGRGGTTPARAGARGLIDARDILQPAGILDHRLLGRFNVQRVHERSADRQDPVRSQ